MLICGFNNLFSLLILSAIISGLFASPFARADERPETVDRERIIRIFTSRPTDTPRNQRYMALINLERADPLPRIDLEWFNKDEREDVSYASRAQTNAVGRLAFMLATEGTRHYDSEEAMDVLREVFRSVVKHTNEEGRFTWERIFTRWGYEAHEHAWRLEPLLLAYIWVGDRLPEDERADIEAALHRAGGWLYNNPLLQTNNRGVVWVSLLTLCAHYFEEPEWLALADQHAENLIAGVVVDDGEVGEHTRQYGVGGPCSNYSYTGWSYVYTWRVVSGRDDLDGRLRDAVRWFIRYNTLTGWPLATGASVRVFKIHTNIHNVIPALEMFAREDPFMALVADLWLDRLENEGRGFGGHIVAPIIWALLEEEAEAPPAGAGPPEWYADQITLYERPSVHYALVSRSYQTGVTFRGRTGGYEGELRGMQTFAFGNEPPILLHTNNTASRVLADGIDSALTDVAQGRDGWEVFYQVGNSDDKLSTIISRRGHIWTIYAYTPVAAVVVTGGAQGDIQSRWVMNTSTLDGAPELDAGKGMVGFPNREARIYYIADGASLETSRGAHTLNLRAGAPVSVTAFSGKEFSFADDAVNGDRISFSDSSGEYTLSLENVLNNAGNINRGAELRLKSE